MPLNRERKETRRKSMLGTALFGLGIIIVVLSVIASSVWMAVAAAALLVPGVLMLYQVGKTLS